MPQTEIVHQDDTLRIGVSRNLIVSAWSNSPEPDHIRILHRALHSISGKHRSQHAMLDLVTSGTPRFSDTIREELVKVIRDPRLGGKGTAHVVAIAGIGGTTVRTFLSTILLVARPVAPNKVFADIAPAAAWLAPLASTEQESWNTADIIAVATEITGRPGKPAPATK